LRQSAGHGATLRITAHARGVYEGAGHAPFWEVPGDSADLAAFLDLTG
jgi:hypothetical protein